MASVTGTDLLESMAEVIAMFLFVYLYPTCTQDTRQKLMPIYSSICQEMGSGNIDAARLEKLIEECFARIWT